VLENCSDFSVLKLREVDFDRLDIDLSKCRCLIEGLQDWWDGDGWLIVVYPWRSAWHWRLSVLFPCVAWLPLHWLNVWMHLVHRRRQGTGLLLCVVVVSRTIISLALLRWVSFSIFAWRWRRPALNRGTLCLGMLRLVNLRWTSSINGLSKLTWFLQRVMGASKSCSHCSQEYSGVQSHDELLYARQFLLDNNG
jgi:hypothetical protein